MTNKMGKKDSQQSDEENRGVCRQCLRILRCCHLPASTGVKIVSIVSILIGLVFCCLGVWMIIVTTNNNELAPRNQLVYEILQPAYPSNDINGPLSQSVFNTVANAKDQESISTQSSLFDTSSVYLTSSSQSGTGNSSNWPLSSVSTGKGPSGRKPPLMNHTGPKKLIPLSNYHTYLLCLGILSICVGFMRTLASIFLLWNSVEKHSKTPGAVWILFNVLGTVAMLVYLTVILHLTGFLTDFPPWSPSVAVKNDKFNFYLLLAMLKITCVMDFLLTFYFTLIVLCFVRTLN